MTRLTADETEELADLLEQLGGIAKSENGPIWEYEEAERYAELLRDRLDASSETADRTGAPIGYFEPTVFLPADQHARLSDEGEEWTQMATAVDEWEGEDKAIIDVRVRRVKLGQTDNSDTSDWVVSGTYLDGELRCPFCGSEDVSRRSYPDGGTKQDHKLKCDDCGESTWGSTGSYP